MKNFWEWLSGKKTIIGLFILALIGQTFFLNLLPDGDVENAVIWILQYIGLALTGTGAVHKIAKWKEAKNILKDYR